MIVSDLILESISTLRANKMRTFLTILGIVIGIASVIVMISIGEGVQKSIESNIETLGSNLLIIYPGALQNQRGFISMGRGSVNTLKNEDAELIKQVEGVQYVAPIFQRQYQIVSQTGYNTRATVVGTISDYYFVRNIKIANGRFLSNNDDKSYNKVAILGANVKEDLFPNDDNPVGKNIKINRVNFKVIGVLEAKGGGFGLEDDSIFVPLLTLQKILAGVDYLSTISLSAQNQNLMSQIQEKITQILLKQHRVSEPDFSFISQQDILATLNQVTTTFTIFLASIAGISLLVGGIGIMNMMLTNVTERTHEIGLRKAVGAKKKDITLQFLTEAIILTTIGGIVGIIFGFLGSIVVSKLVGVYTSVSLFAVSLSLGISVLVGLVFGYYPAKRAANLNPIDALRYE